MDPVGFVQRLGIQESQLRCAVAHDELLPVLGQRPALALIVEFTLYLEAREVVDETHVRLPGEADEAAVPIDDAFAEVLRGHVDLLHHRSGVDAHLADGRVLFQARALVQEAVQIEQSFSVGRHVVRVGVDDVHVINRNGRPRGAREQG